MGLFRSFLATLVLALVALVAISPVSTNASVVQDRKFAKLQSMALENKGIVELDSALFDEFVSTPRNYSIVILFTAMGPQFQCTPCKQFEPEFKLVASGWSRLPEKSKLFYARLDFEVGQMVFQKLGMNTAPTVMLLSPAKSESNQSPPSRYDFATQGMHADGFTTWIKTQTGFHVPVRRPINYVVLGVKVSGGLGVLAFLFGAYLNADKISIRRYIWSAVSLLTIFVMISGHMWNHIRRPAYNIPGRSGQDGFIAQGFQNQLGLETQVIAILYALLSGSSVVLVTLVPRIESPIKQRIAVWVAMGLFGFIFSLLIQIFRVKNPAYPYTLLHK